MSLKLFPSVLTVFCQVSAVLTQTQSVFYRGLSKVFHLSANIDEVEIFKGRHKTIMLTYWIVLSYYSLNYWVLSGSLWTLWGLKS